MALGACSRSPPQLLLRDTARQQRVLVAADGERQVQILGTVPQSVTLGTWYDLRLEIIGIDVRAYVNGDLKISARDASITGGGRNAILMYKAAADWYHYIAYQP